jgi:hypothetical protein
MDLVTWFAFKYKWDLTRKKCNMGKIEVTSVLDISLHSWHIDYLKRKTQQYSEGV